MCVHLEGTDAPGEIQRVSLNFPSSQEVATDDGGYFWNTGDWELPDEARTRAAEGQAAVALPDCFPPPRSAQLGFVNCKELFC